MKTKNKKWSEEEKQDLMNWLENGWDYHFPGYEQAAMHINDLHNNGRTASSCKSMAFKLTKQLRVSNGK